MCVLPPFCIAPLLQTLQDTSSHTGSKPSSFKLLSVFPVVFLNSSPSQPSVCPAALCTHLVLTPERFPAFWSLLLNVFPRCPLGFLSLSLTNFDGTAALVPGPSLAMALSLSPPSVFLSSSKPLDHLLCSLSVGSARVSASGWGDLCLFCSLLCLLFPDGFHNP